MEVRTYPDLHFPVGLRFPLTLGNFDGVHLGHRALVTELKELARGLGTPSVAVTFEPHPVSVLRPDKAPERILTPKQKEEALAELGMDYLIVIPFTVEFSRTGPERFVKDVIVEKLRASELILGTNFRFGHGRAGDLDTLRSLGKTFGFTVREVKPALYEGEMISSSRIRGALAEGRVEQAAAMLGRAYFVDGNVVKGDGRGGVIGFHTANLAIAGSLLVSDGVYVTSARVGDRVYPSMSHIGSRPTFGLNSRAVEAHLFDFSRDIYGADVRLHFHERIRGTLKFRGVGELQRQLGSDRERALAFFRGRDRNLVL